MAQVFGLFFIIFYLDYVYFSHITSTDQVNFFNNEQLRCVIKILYKVLLCIEMVSAFWNMLIFHCKYMFMSFSIILCQVL